MAISFLKKRWQRVLFRILITAAALVIVIGCAINFYFSPKLDHKLKSTVLTSTDSLYSLDFTKANLHVLQGKIVISNLVLHPDTAVYSRLKKASLAPNSLYEVKIRRLVIKHVHPFMLYFQKKLDIDQLEITEPEVVVSYEQNRSQDTVLKDKKTPYQLISKLLKSVHIQSILLNDVKLKYVNHDGAKTDSMAFKELNFAATNFLLDPVTQFNQKRFLFCDDVSAELNNYSGTSYDERYTYQVKKIRFSTRSSELNVAGMSFLPTEPAMRFFKNSHADYYTIRLDSLKLNKFDFKTYSKYHKLFAANLSLNTGSFQLFANPVPGDSTKDNSPNFPQMMLKRLSIDLKIDTIHAQKISVLYTELNNKSKQTGTVIFANTSGYLYNLTNNKAALQKNSMATAKLESYFMNVAKLNVDFSFKLGDDNMPFSFKGSLGAMDLKKVNPVAIPLGMVKIASGKEKQLSFSYLADKQQARGKLSVLYNDLRVALLKRDSSDNTNRLKKMSIMSLFANALVIKRDNPAGNEPVRIANVFLPRVPRWSIFTLMWKSLWVGLKECGGYDKQTEQSVKQRLGEMKANKATRAIRKAERKQRRAERRARRELKKQQKEAEKAAKETQEEK
ncbi:hypothetical protein BEL04_18760 [Mucilaginibacter sp. PPCGB 2223]|uniref:hypothetical protein n=1 Tax=Mucilaginibacter sp. PPCGB 2223 TaxID=1886027 RepID=UPI0008258E3E|nr:hypothetical protein [Mucilaginibacter sp. PPCGB 2223]OCX50776.1 hypothetical protein BEL04_18760 [Mucilaginibacter sp. PPCGB 2223]